MSAPDLIAPASTAATEDAPAVDLSVKKQVRNLLELNQVIIIRHGEKTPADPVNLSKLGEVRANYLPAFLLDKDSPWKRPEVIYAMKQSGPKGSKRPLETVLPLAEALKIAVNEGGVNEDKTLYNNLYQHQSKALVESILGGSHRGETVLISWEHKVEVDIAHHLGIPVKGWGLDPFNRNDGSNFTAMWVLTPSGESATFEVFKEFEVDPKTLEVTFPDKKQKSLDTKNYASHELREIMKVYKKDIV